MSLDRKPKGVFTIIEADNVERPILGGLEPPL